MKVWCPVEDEPISRSDTVRGYEYRPGEYVVIDEDLETVPLKTVRSIEIEQFMEAERDDAPSASSSSATTWSPDKSVARRSTCSSRCSRTRASGHLQGRHQGPRAARSARPVRRDDAAVHALLAGRDPSTKELELPEEEVDFKPAELAMAKQLVSAMTGEFDPAQYKDEYREALEKIIEAKVDGKETVEIEEPEETGKLIDLMAALEASVSAAKASREAGAEKPVSVAEAREAKAKKAAPQAGGVPLPGQGSGRRRQGQAGPEAQDGVARPRIGAYRRVRQILATGLLGTGSGRLRPYRGDDALGSRTHPAARDDRLVVRAYDSPSEYLASSDAAFWLRPGQKLHPGNVMASARRVPRQDVHGETN